MKSARVHDYWKEVYSDSRRYSNYISEISFIDCNGFTGSIKVEPGITVFCGLNGAGKSSIIASIKNLLGISDDSVVSKNKFSGQVTGKAVINRNSFDISFDNTAVSQGLDRELIQYIDCDQTIECLKFWDQSNLDELLESEEELEFTKEQITELNYLVGKNYTRCSSYELSDESPNYIPVFFKVTENSTLYDSVSMGLGEHLLLYIYYLLDKVEKNSILIIEEPESFISVLSQIHLINHLSKVIAEKRITVIISSHSPYILESIRENHIRIISNFHNSINIFSPDQKEEAQKVLGFEYKKIEKIFEIHNKKATVFVEDYAARVFLEHLICEESPYIYKNTDIISVDGESSITARLRFDDSKFMSHRLIGIYDGDMRGKFETDGIPEQIYWPYLFLPVNECIEKEIISFLGSESNQKEFCSSLNLNYPLFISIMSKHAGKDHHDWVLDVAKDINITLEGIIKAFYSIWKKEKEDSISSFIDSIERILSEE